ncbi:MAG: YicC family protein [Planctomycetaceae bacterium]|nr:YicC family protein [Planctomycetaceae bacterium]
MTGFGRGTVEIAGADLTVEVKTVNNRYLKTSLKLPEALSPHEVTFDNDVRAAIKRGTVNVSIRHGSARSGVRYAFNQELAAQYHRQLSELAASLKLDAPADVHEIASLPGVIEAEEAQTLDESELLKAARDALAKALAACDTVREREGKALAADLEARCKTLLAHNEEVRSRAPKVVDSYRQKLEERVSRLLSGSSVELRSEDVAREVAFFADRCDISEEVQRLGHHCAVVLDLIRQPGEAGRKLDFLSQEMLREVNTMGSKAADAQLATIVVSMKSEIEKIKEQVQNIE